MSEKANADADKAPADKPAADKAPADKADAAPVVEDAPVKEMRCVSLSGYGGIRMVSVQKKPEPEPKEGEVLIRTKACGVNFMDLMVRQGAIDNPPKTPFILGCEFAGEVEALGENVTNFQIGDRVVAFTDYNGWSEVVAVSANVVYTIPASMSFRDASAILVNYVTAYILLFNMGNLQKGRSLLVHSAGGGVGLAIAQLCKTVDDVTIFGTASTNKHESIKEHVTHLFDHVVDYAQEIRKIKPEGIDIVLDCLCGEDTNKGISLLKPLGKYVLYGTANVVTGETKSFFSFAKSWWQVDKVNPLKLYDENKTISGFSLRQLLFRQGAYHYVREIVEQLFQWYNEGKVRPTIDSVWAFEDIKEAMQKMHDRKNVGKLLLDPDMAPKEKEADKAAAENASGGEKEKTEAK